ncbi:MAG: DUF3100 domain-containing protein [Hyphomicrobiales bacterium]
MNAFAKQLKLWRLYLAVVIIGVIAEMIGIRKIPFGIGTILLLPMLYAFVIAVVVNPNITSFFGRFIRREDTAAAAPLIGVAIMLLTAKAGTFTGPAINSILKAGPALLLQELGNLGTILFAFPLGVWGLRMGREAIGATFSIAREPNIAAVGARYGLKSAEGTGVMGVYVLGTLFGTFVFSILASVFVSINVFDSRALAMACGVGSSSMMVACAGALSEVVPRLQDKITAFANTSNILTGTTGLYAGLFIALPILERLYPVMVSQNARRHTENARAIISDTATAETTRSRKKLGVFDSAIMLAIVGCIGLIMNRVGHGVALAEGVTGMAVLGLIAMVGVLLARFVPLHLPNIAWVSLVGTFLTLPRTPGSHWVVAQVEAVNFLVLTTPILGFAGLALTRMEIDIAKQTGWKLAVVACFVFFGTYAGSALIAQLVLHWQGI